MPVKIFSFHLRFFPGAMKAGTVRHSRAVPVLSRVFPHKLIGGQFGVGKFSTRASQGIKASKSLIEDESDLSDWVSGLSSNSFKKTRVYSGSENDEDNHVKTEGYRSRERGGKRQRGSEFDRSFDREKRNEKSYNASLFSRGGGKGREPDKFLSRNEGKFGGRLEERNKRDGRFFSEGDDLNSSDRRKTNAGFREKRPEMRDGRGGGREGRGAGRRGVTIMDDNEEEEEEGPEKGYRSFKELLDSDGVDDDDDDDEEEEEAEEDDMDLTGEEHEEEEGLFDKASDFSELQPNATRRSDSYLSESRFDQCSISPLSLKGIKDAGFEKMTLVQEATLPLILKGKDVLAKAKTGTGKTVAFLLPAIEIVLQSPPITRDQKQPPIFVLIICPTRELASQAAAEANTLLKYHPSIGVQVVIGGTRLALEQKRMQTNPCQILVATPGRLRDHVENTAGFATRLMGVKVLVLDEADHLLDMGFRKEIEKIIAAVPKQRQTLLFSATIPPEVRHICHIALKRDHEYINTVQEGTEDTHAQVRQMHLVAPVDNHFSLLYALLKDHIADDVNYKILVFCTTAMVTRLVAELLCELSLNVREIHSRKPQSYRTRISDEFRKSKGLILVTSDVSARGVDYPDVTLVVQMGVPADRQQYIHRLGRTGRKGKDGEGILLLAPWEEFFLSSVKDLPISKASEPLVDPDTRKKVERALSHIEMKNKEAAYQAWLGYYNSNKNVGRDKCRLVQLANEFSRSMGLDSPPAIPKLVLGKMGLKNIPGLRSK
ncbi:DEAD-box ATP-dependent RNA helicase 31-like [Dorcoceras hygrometricum]|uniref:ATP-dependent RNA helicase n=1 Tax=Dorcoceras hygrometricum TaxID=472368 RepID=A0A2Z7AJA0_9LAMI|nr:DEAD-box ATP-dependent RNA helicase 31-like [Dorcoceras hygrometricum]